MYFKQYKISKKPASDSSTINQITSRPFKATSGTQQNFSQNTVIQNQELSDESNWQSDNSGLYGMSIFAPGNHLPPPRPIQTKLSIGQPGDKYEQEADRTAADVIKRVNTLENISVENGLNNQISTAPVARIQRVVTEAQDKKKQDDYWYNLSIQPNIPQRVNSEEPKMAVVPDTKADLSVNILTGKKAAEEWVKNNPKPKGLKPFPDPRKQKQSNQTSAPAQNITSDQLGRTKGMNEFLKTIENPETFKGYQELEQFTKKDALKQDKLLGKGGFGKVYAYKQTGSLDTDPATHVIKEETDDTKKRNYDQRKVERKRAVFIPLVANELGFTHMPLATSIPQEKQGDSRQNKDNKLLSTLVPGKDGRDMMKIAADPGYALTVVESDFTKFFLQKTGKFLSDPAVSNEEKEQLKQEFGFDQKLSAAEAQFNQEKIIAELDVDEQQIQDVVILDMLFQYKDGSFTQYMFNQGGLKKIDNDDYGIAKVDRNYTQQYSSSFPVGLPNANQLLTEDTKKRLLNMDKEHLKKVLQAATYKDKSGLQSEKQQVFDEKRALRNLEDLQFLIKEADKYGGISLRELFDLYNSRDEDEGLDPEISDKTTAEYESRIKKTNKQEDEVVPSQLYNILGVDFPENRKDLVINSETHKKLGEIDKERQKELKEKRQEKGYAPSIKDNPAFIKAIEQRSNRLQPERREAVLKERNAAKLKGLNELVQTLPTTFKPSLDEITAIPQSILTIQDTDQTKGIKHIFSQVKNRKARKMKSKIREQVANPMAGNTTVYSEDVRSGEKNVENINHKRIKSKAEYPLQIFRFREYIPYRVILIKDRFHNINKPISQIIASIKNLQTDISLEEKSIRDAYISVVFTKIAPLEAEITELNRFLDQLDAVVNNILEHQEYIKNFGKVNVFEKEIANLKENFEFYQIEIMDYSFQLGAFL